MSILKKIRQRILNRDYYLSSHAEEEMLDDQLNRKDIENAVLKGKVVKKLTQDARGTRYKIEGPSHNDREIGVVCRFTDEGTFVIITVYAIMEDK